MKKISATFRCVLHGSFRKHFDEIKRVHKLFTQAGIEVLAPEFSDIKHFENGFAMLETDRAVDQRMIELLYLHHLKRLGENGFSYFVNPNGYIGKSAAYELGIAQVSNVSCFFKHKLDDHPAYLHKNSVIKPEHLVEYIQEHGKLPQPKINKKEKEIHKLWSELMVPGSVVAVGGIIEHTSDKKEKEILLVKTHKWKGRYSVVGGKVKRNERLQDALLREVKEETGLNASIGRHICTFDQIKNSGYYMSGIQHIFVDQVVGVQSKRVKLNEEAQEYLWIPAKIALKELLIEPNARHTLELYSRIMAVK
ncbi:NUDIX domain-containing protein [Candidatus Parcubacteria bacterium]|nr:NUDIX domain-containing protein [Candidatus Parcubacteria bacterium]